MSFSEKNTIGADFLTGLADLANSADGKTIWPADSWDLVKQAGALRWCIPAEKVSGKWNNYLYLTTAIYLSQIESDAYHTCGCEEIENP